MTVAAPSVVDRMVAWLQENQVRIDQAREAQEKVIVRFVIGRNGGLYPELTIKP